MRNSEEIYFAVGEDGNIPNKQDEEISLSHKIKNENIHSNRVNIYNDICDQNIVCSGVIYFHHIEGWSKYKRNRIKQLLLDWNDECIKRNTDDQSALNNLINKNKFRNYGRWFKDKHINIFNCNLFPNGIKYQRNSW